MVRLISAATRKKINGKTYFFDDDGKMRDGWYQDGTDVYYLGDEDDGARASGWLWLEVPEEEDVDVNGHADDNDICDEEGWYYFGSNGKMYKDAAKKKINGKYYYFNMAALMAVNTDTPDGYHVDENGVWDGNASTVVKETVNLGPGVATGWEPVDIGWKFRLSDGSYLTNSWKQDPDGKWYYLNEDGWMLKDTTTPDGFYVDENGVWQQDAAAPETAE